MKGERLIAQTLLTGVAASKGIGSNETEDEFFSLVC